jgi:hypothetical protein
VQPLIQPSTIRAAGDPVHGQPTVRVAQSPAALIVKWSGLLPCPFEVVTSTYICCGTSCRDTRVWLQASIYDASFYRKAYQTAPQTRLYIQRNFSSSVGESLC